MGAAGAGEAESRAARRLVEPGNDANCAACGERVKFQAKARNEQVICNVYVDGAWDRVEHFHLDCYEQAGEPYGAAEAPTPRRG